MASIFSKTKLMRSERELGLGTGLMFGGLWGLAEAREENGALEILNRRL